MPTKHSLIKDLLDDIMNNILGNFELSKIVQQFISDDTLIPITNDIHTPITENRRTSISASSIDESFKKLELKICELNKSVNHELDPLNKQMDSFFLNI